MTRTTYTHAVRATGTAPIGPTYRCGLCGLSKIIAAGRWRHRALGYCCAACKPGANG